MTSNLKLLVIVEASDIFLCHLCQHAAFRWEFANLSYHTFASDSSQNLNAAQLAQLDYSLWETQNPHKFWKHYNRATGEYLGETTYNDPALMAQLIK